MSNDLVEFFERTKTELKERGRTVGRLYDKGTGCVCLLGAMGFAAGIDLTIDESITMEGVASRVPGAVNLLSELISEDYKYGLDYDYEVMFNPVWRFNDRNGRGQQGDERVNALLDQAIAAASA